MAIQINNGFTAFDTFVQFAQHRAAAGLQGEVAKATANLDQRRIGVVEVGSASKTSSGWFSRTDADKADNDTTREIFKAAVAKMFGGENKIPADVRKAMEMENYGQGKPLTARRILLVKAAIDRTDASIREADLKFQATGQKVFDKLQPETRAALVAKGYTRAELPNIARAVKAYAKSQNVSEAEAAQEVTTAGTKANRLASYGGRFLASAESFADGLRLLDSFDEWYTDLKAFKDKHSYQNEGADTPTKLHVDGYATVNNSRRGFETMLFQHIAVDSSIDLKKDGEEVFGMANNAATRFFGRNIQGSVLGTVVNVPPAKRHVLFAAVDAFQPLFRNGEEAAAKWNRPAAEWKIRDPALFVSRCAAHLDELLALHAQGQLTAKNIIKVCFPDIEKPGRCDLKALNEGTAAISEKLDNAVGELNSAGASLRLMSSGATVDEIIRFYQDGTPPPQYPNVTDWTMRFQDFEGGGFTQMSGDLVRTYNYAAIENGEPNPAHTFVPGDQVQNNVAFPDGSRIACSSRAEHRGNPAQVESKIKALCGEAHGFQAEVVAFCLSQAGKSPIRHALAAQGIDNAEHAVVDFSLSKDEITGAVTVHYTSPASLPVRFSWNATVNVDGTVVSTPMRIEQPIREMTIGQAREMIRAAADKYDFELTKSQLAEGAVLLARNAPGLLPGHAKLLAQFVAKLPLGSDDGETMQRCARQTASFAKDLKTTRSFAFGDPRMKDAETFFKNSHNAYVAAQFNQAGRFGDNTKPGSSNVFTSMIADLSRSHVTINGQAFAKDEATDYPAIFAAFKKALPSEKAQKAVSILMHQGVVGDIFSTQLKAPTAGENGTAPAELFKTPAGKMFLQRDMDVFEKQLVNGSQEMHFDLMVSPDGNTATITIGFQDGIFTGNPDEETCGTLKIQQKVTLDLRPDIPVVSDVKLSQTVDP